MRDRLLLFITYHSYCFTDPFFLGQWNSRKCSGYSAVKEGDDTFVDNKEDSDDCITVTVVENSENPIQLVSVRDLMIPFFLGTTIKG